MPAKRKAATKAKASPAKKAKASPAKKAKACPAKKIKAEDSDKTVLKKAMSALKKGPSFRKKTYKCDEHCPLKNSAKVVDDYDCMLNQTNIGHNNNKYYVIQVLENCGNYYAWNRWGRVGEPGANKLNGPLSKENAIKDFKKKFQDKTRNNWDNRATFEPSPGKYTLLEMGEDDDDDDASTTVVKSEGTANVTYEPSKLEKPTQDLMKFIFNHDMFKEAMANLNIDVKKLPLGKLSKPQIVKGFEVLDELDTAVKKPKPSSAELSALTSRFYTAIPHNFGRQRPPVLSTADEVREKMDMLLVLGDIELAQQMEKELANRKTTAGKAMNPLDAKYEHLRCGLGFIDKGSKDFNLICEYLNNTMGYRKVQLDRVWRVDRQEDVSRFRAHDSLANRKLLWHGTNVAVVAAILKGGLRIMPHSGGRVGSGIYFASENGKSAAYVGAVNKTGIMFLNEVALGKPKEISRDDHTLKSAPAGFDSVIARGRTEPDPKLDTTVVMDKKPVVVPRGKPVQQSKWSNTSFGQSEYLVYRESQCRIRYLLQCKFEY